MTIQEGRPLTLNPLTRETLAAYRQGFNDAIQRAYAEIRTIELAERENLETVRSRIMALMQNERD